MTTPSVEGVAKSQALREDSVNSQASQILRILILHLPGDLRVISNRGRSQGSSISLDHVLCCLQGRTLRMS